jgi:hypothetical protein
MFANLELIKEYLKNCDILLCHKSLDGRINSCLDEDNIIKILQRDSYIYTIIKLPPTKRWWYDLLILNDEKEYVPLNIKSSTCNGCDNSGNLSVIVQAYTTYKLDMNKQYNNGELSKIFIESIKNGYINTDYKKDYYFLVLNKNNGYVITNSVLGLQKITYNNNNLPFQIQWKNNRVYNRVSIKTRVNEFITWYKNRYNWKYDFIDKLNKIEFI